MIEAKEKSESSESSEHGMAELVRFVGWEIPDCPMCGKPMAITDCQIESNSNEEITRALVNFVCCVPYAIGHQVAGPLTAAAMLLGEFIVFEEDSR
jgi:hypothetical protein